MTALGELSLWIALLMAIWAAALSFAGGALDRPDLALSGERAIHATSGFLLLAASGLATALVTGDFALRYVATFTNEQQPWLYKLSALWSARAGSRLFWALVVSALASAAVRLHREAVRELRPWWAGTLGAALAVCVGIAALGEHPFARLDVAPVDGRGLDPRLQHPGMALLPPVLYAGYGAALVPCALVLAARLRRRLDERARSVVHAWTLVAWGLLAAAILTRLWLAYSTEGVLPSPPALVRAPGGNLFTTLLALSLLATAHVTGTRTAPAGPSPAAPSRGRRYAWWVCGAGAALVLAGFAGSAFRRETRVMLREGETTRATDPWGRAWSFTSQGASRFEHLNRFITAVAVLPVRDGARQRLITSQRREFLSAHDRGQFPPTIAPGIRSSLAQDVIVTLVHVEGARADLRIAFNPLVAWVWVGGALAIAGSLAALWPRSGDAGAAGA